MSISQQLARELYSGETKILSHERANWNARSEAGGACNLFYPLEWEGAAIARFGRCRMLCLDDRPRVALRR